MHFTATSDIAFFAFAVSAAAASPVVARQDVLQDWQVSSVSVFTPSGRPGSYPWARIQANVTDPNEINLGTAPDDGHQVIIPGGSQGLNCEAKWFTKGESPLDRTWPCDPVGDGYWVMKVEPGTNGFGTGDFNLKFLHVPDTIYHGAEYTATFAATGHFEVGKNMAGTCGASGVCNWGLKPDSKPVKITPSKV